MDDIYFSIIIPVYNEAGSIFELYRRIACLESKPDKNCEIIFIDDGSIDGSFDILNRISCDDKRVRIIRFKRNFGQTAAISAGIDFSRGKIIVPMDADLQNDPADIPVLLKKIEQGYDVVSGWRKNRRDNFLFRKLPSWAANYLISFITKVKLHDYGCTIKAYKKEVIKDICLYGEMHRFIPAYAAWHGARITEVVVNHFPRRFGKTKYGFSRTFKVILDLLVVVFLTNYMTKPIHFFGKIGFWSLFCGFLTGIWSVILKIFYNKSFSRTPLPLATVLFIIIGIQFILMGLLAEIIIRVYYERQDKKTYLIKDRINF